MGSKGGGGGGGTTSTTEYVQSPEAREAMQLMMPSIERLGAAGATGGALWDIPQTPAYGTLLDYGMMMPTTQTFADISPEMKEAAMAPYKETSLQLMEQMGQAGYGGSARGGLSGAGAAGLGKYWGDVAPEYTKSLWGMVAPGLQAGYGAEMDLWGRQAGMEDQAWQQDIMARQFPYTAIPGIFGSSMPQPMVQQGGSSGGKK